MVRHVMSEQDRISHCLNCVDKYRSEMEDLINTASDAGVEMGFLFCIGVDGKYTLGTTSSGEKRTITLKDCGGRASIGSFHVHMIGYPVEPSMVDIATCFKRNDAFIAIGSRTEGIRCFYPYETEEFHSFLRIYNKAVAAERKYEPFLKALAEEGIRGGLPMSENVSKVLVDFLSGKYVVEDYIPIVDAIDEASSGETALGEYIQRSLKNIDMQELIEFSIHRAIANDRCYGNKDRMYVEITDI